jgi:hypothetical protein
MNKQINTHTYAILKKYSKKKKLQIIKEGDPAPPLLNAKGAVKDKKRNYYY